MLGVHYKMNTKVHSKKKCPTCNGVGVSLKKMLASGSSIIIIGFIADYMNFHISGGSMLLSAIVAYFFISEYSKCGVCLGSKYVISVDDKEDLIK